MKKIFIYILLFFFLGNNFSVYATDLDDVRDRVNKFRSVDTSLPSVSDQKGIIGTIFSLVFDTNGRIRTLFLEITQTLSSNYIPRWNGTIFVNGTIYDNGTNVGIGTTSPSTRLQVNGNIQATSIKVSCIGNCF